MSEENAKRFSPEELEELYACKGDSEHPPCPIYNWCMAHFFKPDTCQESWKQYLAQLDH